MQVPQDKDGWLMGIIIELIIAIKLSRLEYFLTINSKDIRFKGTKLIQSGEEFDWSKVG